MDNNKPKAELDCYVIQGNYGGSAGWEDLTAFETYKEARSELKVYRANDVPSASHRIQKVFKSGYRRTVK